LKAGLRLLGSLLFFWATLNSGLAQQSASPEPLRDSQALVVLQRALQAAGGLHAVDAVQSYSASGRITFYWTEDGTEGDLTMKGRGIGDFRLDAHLPDGTDEWWTIRNGRGFKKDTDGTVHPLLYQELINLQSLCLPRAQLARAIRDSRISVSSLKTAVREGRASLGVRIRTVPSPSGPDNIVGKLSEKDFYVDAQTFQITTVEDLSYPTDKIANGLHRQVTFSDYRDVGGTFFPFSMSEQVGKNRRLMEIHLKDLSVNPPLTDHDFEP